jgi:hypothetical protein
MEAAVADDDDDHAGIPRDANGDPIFLILPPAMQAEYDRKLAACWAGWEATKDPAAPLEALILAHCYRQTTTNHFWLVEAACTLMLKRRTKGYITRHYNATIRWMRYAAVRDAERTGLSWDDAYEDAAQKLANTNARGEARTMRGAYDEVIGDLRAGRGALYFFTPKIPNLGGARTRKTASKTSKARARKTTP